MFTLPSHPRTLSSRTQLEHLRTRALRHYWACEHFETTLKDRRPLIFTDHQALTHSEREPKEAQTMGDSNRRIPSRNRSHNRRRQFHSRWMSRSVAEDLTIEPEHMFAPTVYQLVRKRRIDKLPSPTTMQAEAKAEEAELPSGTLDGTTEWLMAVCRDGCTSLNRIASR